MTTPTTDTWDDVWGAHPITYTTPYGVWRRFSRRPEDIPHLQAFGRILEHCYREPGWAQRFGQAEHWTLTRDTTLCGAITVEGGRVLLLAGPKQTQVRFDSPMGRALAWLDWKVRIPWDSVVGGAPFNRLSIPEFPLGVLLQKPLAAIAAPLQATLHAEKASPVLNPSEYDTATWLRITTRYFGTVPHTWHTATVELFLKTLKVQEFPALPASSFDGIEGVLYEQPDAVNSTVWIPLVPQSPQARQLLLERLNTGWLIEQFGTHTAWPPGVVPARLYNYCCTWATAKAKGDKLSADVVRSRIAVMGEPRKAQVRHGVHVPDQVEAWRRDAEANRWRRELSLGNRYF